MDILIIKTGALGDVVRTSFIAQALREKYLKYNPRIYWITGKNAVPLFINNPYVFKVISSENKEALNGHRFDIVINLEEDEGSCKFASSLRYGHIIGFIYKNRKIIPTPSAKEWFDMSALGEKPYNDLLKKNNKKTHRQIISEMMGVKDHQKYEPFLRLNANQRKICSDFSRRHRLSRADIIVGINTGSAERWPKQLSIEKTAQLITALYRKHNAKILLFGGPNEAARNNEIIKLSRAPVIDTGCGNDLIEFPALISACSIFITTDTLGMHIALALKRKTIILVGPTSSAEIDTYGLGEKILPKSDCLCCYKKDCKSMEKIEVKNILSKVERFLIQKITLLITAFNEPKISKAIESAINQKTHYKYDILVSAPDEDTLSIARKYKKHRVKIFKDPGKGKVFAINMILKHLNTDIIVLTDGDVYLSNNSIEEVTNLFLDPEIGCVTGRPVPMEDRKTKYGYWANFLFDSAHNLRKRAFEKNSFLECSGYLFAFRKEKITQIPLDVAEDAIIPYDLWEKGYRIGYAEKALVYVKNVDNWKDWIKQKTRTSRAHETLGRYVDIQITPRVKKFSTESKGIIQALIYPGNLKECFWTSELIAARFYMWLRVFYSMILSSPSKIDAWERVESAR